jgi:hypothetical protein
LPAGHSNSRIASSSTEKQVHNNRSPFLSSRFGDAKSSTDPDLGGEPDFICLEDFGAVRVVGKVKTPWKHSLADAMAVSSLWRKYLGKYA